MDGFACRLKRIRESAGLSLAELAERAGISKTYLWELEKDEAGEKSPSVDVAKRLAAALSVGLLDLVGDDDDRHNLREQLIRRACAVMGWDYHTSPVWTGLRKVTLAEAVPISLEKLSEMLDRIEKKKPPLELVQRLVNALQLLLDAQNGPPLLRYKDREFWNKAMEAATAALKRAEEQGVTFTEK